MMTDAEKAALDRADLVLNALEDWSRLVFYWDDTPEGIAHAEGFRKAQDTVRKIVKKRYDA